MSKGSRPRPFSISQQEYDTRWDAIFGRDRLEDQLVKSESSDSRNNPPNTSTVEDNITDKK
jgi:hypothetical protein